MQRRSDRFAFNLVLLVVIGIATGACLAFTEYPMMAIVAGVITGIAAIAKMLTDASRYDIVYPTQMAMAAEDTTEPNLVTIADADDHPVKQTHWFLPSQVPMMPSAAAITTNTPVRLDSHPN